MSKGDTTGDLQTRGASEDGANVEQARRVLLERHAPPYFVVSSVHTLLHCSPAASPFLAPSAQPHARILDVVSGELADALAGALRATKGEARYERVTAETREGPVPLALTVSSLDDGALLVTLERAPTDDEAELATALDRHRREAARRRERFLAMLSHELRNPLAAIGSAADIIEESGPPALEKVAGVLTRQTQHLKTLLDDLLDANRVTLDRFVIQRERVALAEVVARSLEAVEPLAGESGVELLTSQIEDVSLDGDPTRLQQMLTNLLVNAVSFSDRGDTVRLDAVSRRGQVIIRVIDEGIGIAPEDVERVFDLFYQDAQSLDRARGGLGVGLTLARTIAVAHGGELRASSAGRGLGASFVATLPLRAGHPQPAEPSAAPARGGLTVAVVEDQQDNLELLSIFVTMRGHRTIAVRDGEEAVATILASRPHLALIDIGLPGIDGYEVARRIRALEDGARLYLVALTGYGRAEDRERARRAGFDDHVVKPLAKGDLDRLLALAARPRT